MKASWKGRFSIGTVMVFVLTSAVASALFTKVRQNGGPISQQLGYIWIDDGANLLLLSIGLTTAALALWKGHNATQAMLQGALTCLLFLTPFWAADAELYRVALYWFQWTLAATVVLPLLIRRLVEQSLPVGPVRERYKSAREMMLLSFLNFVIVISLIIFQMFICEIVCGVRTSYGSTSARTVRSLDVPLFGSTPPSGK